MKKIFTCCFLTIFSLVFGQKITPNPLETIVVKADTFVGYDKFGFLYGIADNVFFKWKDNQSVEYKKLSLGKISKVDLQNPLKIVLFYENFNAIVTLDNQLNEIQEIHFSDISTPIVATAAAMASQNRFWIYDSLSQRLGFFDPIKNTFVPITQSLQGNIVHYEADFNYFQWIDDKENRYACDVFGKISMYGKTPDFDKIQIINPELLLYSKDGILYLNDLKSAQLHVIENSGKTFKSFYYKDQILAIFTADGITNYKITLP